MPKPRLKLNRDSHQWECHYMDQVLFGHSPQDAFDRLRLVIHRTYTKTQEKPDQETFSELLDSLDDVFEVMKIPPFKDTVLHKQYIKAIHKLGIFIPTPWLFEWVREARLPDGVELPMIASASLIPRKYDHDDIVHPRYIFAIKELRLPDGVQYVPGTPYLFGYCVNLNELEHDPSSPPRTYWLFAWIVVKPDRSLVISRELQPTVCQVRHRRTDRSCQKLTRSRSSRYTQMSWQLPRIAYSANNMDADELTQMLLCEFRQLLIWWQGRHDRWSVGVRKDGVRATFSIAKQHTAAYFADRKRVVNHNGATKRIIHYVRPHIRENGSQVKAHLRGLREFDWRGYHCLVTAPKLNGFLATHAAINPKEDKKNGLELDEVAEALADYEDYLDTSRLD